MIIIYLYYTTLSKIILLIVLRNIICFLLPFSGSNGGEKSSGPSPEPNRADPCQHEKTGNEVGNECFRFEYILFFVFFYTKYSVDVTSSTSKYKKGHLNL